MSLIFLPLKKIENLVFSGGIIRDQWDEMDKKD